MIWSLIKICAFIAIVIGLTFGATLLMDMPGGATIQIAGQEATFGPLELVFGLVILVILVWLGLKLLAFLVASFRFLNGDETAISRYFDRNREKKGYEALSEGMMALASGEGHLAMTKAARAERYLEQPQLTTLLTAQAAEMTGDKKKAEDSYRKLLEGDKTRFVGVRGIMKQKLLAGDTDTAMALAKKAFALKPKHEETQDVLLKLQAEKEDWEGARETLGAKLKSGYLPRDVHKRRDAVLALSSAKDIWGEGASVEAREIAIEANRLSPDLIPAAVLAAQSYIEANNQKYAARVLIKAWGAQPHPELAATFAAIVPDETPAARIKRFRALIKQNPTHAESKMLLAELNLAAEDFPAARKALNDLAENDPTARSLTIMAAIERGEGADEAAVRGWLAKAVSAPRGPQWICDNCQNIEARWVPTCSNCSSIDTLSWKTAPFVAAASSTGTEMLPLLVGSSDTEVENIIEISDEISSDEPAREDSAS